ncbi:histone-lysine N-methyltransferase, H3 lysine-9 specific SUVH6-like [Dorcoceras hygrometricum]|uniref:Histone-lysine N-methyltransferase, H3 lysine-9 specific SUVH6-like n=1 Tax=Dorcoceras hygrometricum TaxID=472368 RepID=A0A2Z7AEC9_9LAMI|nr:histone-lysine N-methyltransferase, H3 lysine-9 specific SUVH6-like [Dorcoceras hygrometricum]
MASGSNKRHLDNGYMPQWKSRKVSAVRDFPPACGPNYEAISSGAAENNGDGASVFKPEYLKANVRVGAGSCKIPGGDATEISKFCNTHDSGMDGVKGPTMKTRHRGTEFTAMVDCELHGVSEGATAEVLNAVVGTLSTTPLEETTVNELNGVEPMELLQNSIFKEKPLLDAGTAIDGASLSGPSHTSSSSNGLNVSGRVEIKTTHRPKDKYWRRRVLAVRDFPPLCGTNAPQSTKEQEMLTCANSYLDELKKGMVITKNYSNREEPSLTPKTNKCLDLTENVDLKTRTTEIWSYDSGREALVEELIEGAGTSDIQVATRPNMVARPLQECNGCVNYVKIRKPEETHVRSRDMSKAPVHGKIKVCLGNLQGVTRKGEVAFVKSDSGTRKGNLALIHSEGGTKTGKMRKQHLSWPRESTGFTSNCDFMADCPGPSVRKAAPVSPGADGILVIKDLEHHSAFDHQPETNQNFMVGAVFCSSDEDSKGPTGKKVNVLLPCSNNKSKPAHSVLSCPNGTLKKVGWGNSDGGKARKQFLLGQHKIKAFAKKSYAKSKIFKDTSMDHKIVRPSVANRSPGALVLTDKRCYRHEIYSPDVLKPEGFKTILPPFEPKSSSHGDARKRVRETLRLFHAICRKLLHEEEVNSMHEQREKSRQPNKGGKRIDLRAANYIKNEGKEVNTGKILGEVPGVQVGDEFQYRVELAVVGIHRLYQNGIDTIKLNGKMLVASSIVASGAYADDMESGDILIYSGQGGNVVEKDREPEDQKLEKGNLALKNSILAKTPVRVVRGWKVKTADSKTVSIYIYDGLYTVKHFWSETGPHGKLVFMFELWRNPGQPELAWKELKRSNKSKIRKGVCVDDISGGKEPFPICVVNILNDEKPPPFNYISTMMYPDWYHPISPTGCDCTGRCSDSRRCQCAAKNGGEIPYNRNGAIVETKPLVYECGPSCKCPPSCYNRVSQRGIKFQLEIFNTESRGWGVRSLNSIPSGSFICEYSGELLGAEEAEKRGDDDEYLFNIGHDYNMPVKQTMIVDYGESGFTIDAACYGNVGRFINHSCSPNLYAQNVVYDNDDKRMPHVMLFAAENIPPLQELTCHYNYKVGQVCDSNGEIKIKKCFCGAPECGGRLY